MQLTQMLKKNTTQFYHHLTKHFCTTSSPLTPQKPPPTSVTWRNQAQQRQLITQVTTTLLQLHTHHWDSTLSPLNLSSHLTPQTFLQILTKTQTNPQTSLHFFQWAKTKLGFTPDLKAHCKMVQILSSGLGQSQHVKPILDSFIGVENVKPNHVVFHMLHACKDTNLHSNVFSLILESYAEKGCYFDGLYVYRKVVSYGYLVNVGCLNKLLGVLEHASEFYLACCLFGSMFRNLVLPDVDTWSVVARIFCKSGKFECVLRLLDFGVCSYEVFGIVVDYYSRKGDFSAAIDHVDEMSRKNLEPGFDIYGSILDGACEFGDVSVIDEVMCVMRERNLIPKDMSREYDVFIKKFCELGKTFAAEFLFNNARGEGVKLRYSTFGRLLRAFCKGGRVSKAIVLYRVILKEKILLKKSDHQELAESICKENRSDDSILCLIGLIKRGFSPSVSALSEYLIKLSRMDKWKEVDGLLFNAMLQKGLVPDSGFFCILVKRYCSSGQVDSAVSLHDMWEKSGASWDVTTYNVLLRALVVEKRVNEALRIFECMKRKNAVSQASFLVMISGLSEAKEMKKAMEVHDEMLTMGLKPCAKTYKSLLTVFR